ncbi:MAG: hypothetical protein AMJ62_12980 [Myxococcales bacterium SG8_38]|nr:MAG: hypothetical protein AMJ62_12980 [Myxococcales bacterium SG8_38]
MLALFLVELARMWPALDGAQSFAAASPVSWSSLAAFTVVVTVFFGAYVRGWRVLSRESTSGPAPYRNPGCRRLQSLAGGMAWALVAAHLILLWVMTLRAGPVALSHYELLRRFLSRPLVLAFYMLGLGALGLYLSQGIAASFRAWGFGTRPKSSLRLEVGCTLGSAILMLLAINVLSHFVTGRAYWGAS